MQNNKLPEVKGSYISYMSNLVKESGGDNLAQGFPTFPPPENLIRKLQTAQLPHQYAAGTGNRQLVACICDIHAQVDYTKNTVLVCNGATEVNSLLFTYMRTLFKDNFTTSAFAPAYEAFSQLPETQGLKFVPLRMDMACPLDEVALRQFFRNNNVKLFYVATPGNPCGKVLHEQNFEVLCRIAQEEQVYVVFDCVYDQLYYDRPFADPLQLLNSYTFYVNSFSKRLSITGWRIGYLIAPNVHIEAIKRIHDYTGLCVPAPLQQALADYLSENNMGEADTAVYRTKIKQSYTVVAQRLQDMGFAIEEAGGGYFVYAELPKDIAMTGEEFMFRLYEVQKIAVVPGIHFDKNDVRYVRFSIANEATYLNAVMDRIAIFLNDIRTKNNKY